MREREPVAGYCDVMRYGGFEPVRDTMTGEIVALLPLAGPYDVPPPPARRQGRSLLRPRPGWWLMLLLAWDSLLQRGPQRAPYCMHCGELLHRDGYCTPYPDDRGKDL